MNMFGIWTIKPNFGIGNRPRVGNILLVVGTQTLFEGTQTDHVQLTPEVLLYEQLKVKLLFAPPIHPINRLQGYGKTEMDSISHLREWAESLLQISRVSGAIGASILIALGILYTSILTNRPPSHIIKASSSGAGAGVEKQDEPTMEISQVTDKAFPTGTVLQYKN